MDQELRIHVARQLAEISEVKREAWREPDLDVVLRAHDREAKLLGTHESDKVGLVISDPEGNPIAAPVVNVYLPDNGRD